MGSRLLKKKKSTASRPVHRRDNLKSRTVVWGPCPQNLISESWGSSSPLVPLRLRSFLVPSGFWLECVYSFLVFIMLSTCHLHQLYFHFIMRCAMAGMVSLRHISKEVIIPFQANPSDVCGRKSGTDTHCSPLIYKGSVCQSYSTKKSYSQVIYLQRYIKYL